ncbi:hypothetical protein BGZ95_004493 [Linnemannia exigua]|uniref:Uncharacterized protein n=1 Tax=Linnemannia exigua TaxID=604196 RepID=A0AAD4H326_9FUNG|nr:hypothetical protein BGZ95_004493 [Linnemannia exigua]
MQIQSTIVHSPHYNIELSSLLSLIQGLVDQSAHRFQAFAADISLRKISKVIYYACLVVVAATTVATPTSSFVFSMPISQIAAFVARYFGRQALAPLIEQIIVSVSIAGVSGITGDYVWTKKQLNAVTRQKDAVMIENNTLTSRVAALESNMEQVLASINASLASLTNANNPANPFNPAPATTNPGPAYVLF